MKRKTMYILMLLFSACSTSKDVTEKTENVNLETEDNKINILGNTTAISDSIYKFFCGNWSQSIKPKDISWVNFNDNLRDCLVLEGFNGNKVANDQIALIVRSIEHNKLFVFGQDPKFRGPEVFEAFLSKANDHTPLFDPDVEDFRYITGTIGSGYRGLCQSMIKSIDGKSQSQWRIDLFYDYEIKNSEWDMETGLFNPAYGKEVGEKYYNALLKAWKEGKIILKDYGEE